jgi:thioredoxin reductase (NADPH)
VTESKAAEPLDCVVIGAGPAGLTASIYLARFRRSLRILDAGRSRAALIPTTHNYPGFTDGISGRDLLDRLESQASRYEVHIEHATVTRIERTADLFMVTLQDATAFTTRSVLLATGVEDEKPALLNWHEATLAGAVRWCPVCDGYEVSDREVAVLSQAQSGYRHLVFLRTYTRRLTLFIQPGGRTLERSQRQVLLDVGARVIELPVSRMRAGVGQDVMIETSDGQQHHFDTVYPMIGCTPRTQLLNGMDVRHDEHGLLEVDEHQGTSIRGLYAAGDVVHSLHQISVGAAHAAIAATAIHHYLPPAYR